ncbi:MAG: hypothetical protein Kow0042_18500 [Calditrichia bacterium]
MLITAPRLERPVLYCIQIGLLLLWFMVEFCLDYIFQIEFRQVRWMVIAYVTLFFTAAGGMIGVTARAGQKWTLAAIIMFFILATLAFLQCTVTGL